MAKPGRPMGLSAHRSDYRQHFDDEMIALEQKEAQEAQAERDEEMAAIAEIADLRDHPGYQQMRKSRMKIVQDYRSGAVFKPALLDPEISDAKLGSLLRSTTFIADELEKELLTVESAWTVVEEEKAVVRERRKRGD